jgi:hypothetical protein
MSTPTPQPVLNSLKRAPDPFSAYNTSFLDSPRRTRLQIMLTVSNPKAAYQLATCRHPAHILSVPTQHPDRINSFFDADNKTTTNDQVRPFSENSKKGASVTTSKEPRQQI